MSAEFFLGVDGGGTKTRAWLANASGEIVGRGGGASSNYRAVGAEAAFHALQHAIASACEKARIEPAHIRAACFGLAGADRSGERVMLEEFLHTLLPNARVQIVNDAALILAAGTPHGWGIGIISGTGSFIFGTAADGRTARAGGWGYLLGDEGSGYAIGLGALRAVARAADGRAPQTGLTEKILAQWNLNAASDLIARVYNMNDARIEIAALARVVDDVATDKDEIARAILQEAARELALGARVVADALKFENEIPCAVTGGVFLESKLLETLFRDAAREMNLNLEPMQRVQEPVRGALTLAREIRVDES